MPSTARVQINRFVTVDEIEWQAIQAADAPRTVEVIERELLRAHGEAIHDERRIREYLAIRRAIIKRDGFRTYGGKSARFYFQIQSFVAGLRAARKQIAALNAEVEAIETRVPAHVLRAAE